MEILFVINWLLSCYGGNLDWYSLSKCPCSTRTLLKVLERVKESGTESVVSERVVEINFVDFVGSVSDLASLVVHAVFH